MSESVDEFLEHYGVKGMKWGVRRARNGKIRARATMSKRDLDDADWLDGGTNRPESFNKAYHKTYRNAAGKIRQGIRKINKDPKYVKQDFRKDSPLRKEYYSEISKMSTEQLNAAASRKGASPSKRFELRFDFDVSREAKPTITVRRRDTRLGRKDARKTAKESRGPSALDKTIKAVKEVKHAEDESATFDLVVDEMGYILDLGIPVDEVDEVEQSDNVDEFLAHYGVKGMKWGVRKDRSGGGSRKSKPDSKTPATKKAPEKKGGSSSGSAPKKTVKDIDDATLRDAINRIKLEQEFKRLTTADKSRGRKMVEDALFEAGKETLKGVAVKYATQASVKFIENSLKKGKKG